MSATREQQTRRWLVSYVGPRAYGERWIAPLAAALSKATGRSVRGPQISHWLGEIRPVPEWVEAAMLTVLNDRIAQLLADAGELRKVANTLEKRAAARIATAAEFMPEQEPEPEKEPDNEPSPSMM